MKKPEHKPYVPFGLLYTILAAIVVSFVIILIHRLPHLVTKDAALSCAYVLIGCFVSLFINTQSTKEEIDIKNCYLSRSESPFHFHAGIIGGFIGGLMLFTAAFTTLF